MRYLIKLVKVPSLLPEKRSFLDGSPVNAILSNVKQFWNPLFDKSHDFLHVVVDRFVQSNDQHLTDPSSLQENNISLN